MGESFGVRDVREVMQEALTQRKKWGANVIIVEAGSLANFKRDARLESHASAWRDGHLDAAVNRALGDFNGGSTDLTFDFDVQQARTFIRDLYGSSCGQ